MRRIIAIALAILSLASPVSATAPEAELLMDAATAVNGSAGALNTGMSTVADQEANAAQILDSLGTEGDYTDACRPLAQYVLLLAGAWHGAMVAITGEDTPAMKGNLVVATALYTYYTNPQGLIPVITTDCLNGI